MIKLVNERVEDGYTIKTYSNGAVVRQLATTVSDTPVPEPAAEPEAVEPTQTDRIEAGIDYLMMLAE